MKAKTKAQPINSQQTEHRQQEMENGNIFRLKEVSPRTTTHALLTNELYTNLQRAVSPCDFFFQVNPERFEKGNKQANRKIYDALIQTLVVDTDRIPDRFLELFHLPEKIQLTGKSLDTLFKEIFAKARFPFSDSRRTVFIDDKIIIFRNEEVLTHKEKGKKLTQGEKRRSEIKTTFNTFATLYDAVRSQYHTLDTEKENQQDYIDYQNTVLTLMQEIKTFGKEHIKDASFHKRIDDLIQDTITAQNSKVLAACLYNFLELTFTNSSIDSNHLRGANNKLRKRFYDVLKII
jgi:inorganic triphosphatase YgiF